MISSLPTIDRRLEPDRTLELRGGEWVLGLDGGGTKTAFALADQGGNVLGPFVGAGINPFDQPRWREELTVLLERCPVNADEMVFSSFGLPGYGESERVSSQQLEAVRDFARERYAALNDVAVAFAGALAGKPGVLILAGTGSMAWAGDGTREIRVGGWGEGFGDEGSAHWIGHRALQELSWTLDGRLEDAAFRDGMLNAIGASDGAGLIEWYYALDHPRSHVAGLARSVDRLAEAGNDTARAILREASQLLEAHARAAWNQLNLDSSARFSYAGGVFNSRTLKEALVRALEPLGQVDAPRASPLAGALLDAAQRAGWTVNGAWLERVNLSASPEHTKIQSGREHSA
jgi:N-acetylglucosamine kinase